MIAGANARFSILRGASVNDFGDDIDNNTVAVSGIQGSRKELFGRTGGEDSPDQRTIRRIRIRLPRNTDVLASDRLGDESTGDILLVDSIERPSSFGIAADLIATCTLVESVVVPSWPTGQNFNPFVGYYLHTEAGPTTSFYVNHNLGYPNHTSVFVGGELVLATVIPIAGNLSTLIQFDEPQSNITVVCSL